MAIGIKTGRFQFQRGTKADWEKADLILLDGELAFEQDTRKFKMGDGRSKYIDLEYVSVGQIDFKNATPEQLKLVTGPPGEKGDPLTYDMLTAEQRLELKGDFPIIKSSTPPPLDKKDYLWIKPDNKRPLFDEFRSLDGGIALAVGDIGTGLGFKVSKTPGAVLLYQTSEPIEPNSFDTPSFIKIDDDHMYQVEYKKLGNGYGYELIFTNPRDIDKLMSNVKPSSEYPGVYRYSSTVFEGGEKNLYDLKLVKLRGYEDYNTINVYDEKAKKWVEVAEDGKTGPKGDKGDKGDPGAQGTGVIDINTRKEVIIWTGTMEEYSKVANKNRDILYLIRR